MTCFCSFFFGGGSKKYEWLCMLMQLQLVYTQVVGSGDAVHNTRCTTIVIHTLIMCVSKDSYSSNDTTNNCKAMWVRIVGRKSAQQ